MKRGNFVWIDESKTGVKFEECENGKFVIDDRTLPKITFK